MSDHLTTQQLIAKIETADRRYRKSSTVLLIIIGFAIAATLVLQYQALEQFKQQSAERGAGLKALQEENQRESEKTNRYLQCIARYFANPDRAQTTIRSIDDCTIDGKTGAIVPGTDQTPLASSGSDSTNLSPGPSGGPSNTPVIPIPDPENNPDPNPTPPRGVIPLLRDVVNGVIDSGRGILGL